MISKGNSFNFNFGHILMCQTPFKTYNNVKENM